jgi:uncharacterized protein YndB with AHSA1/START domain
MGNDLFLKISTEIDALAPKVWDALVNPKIIKQYLFGTETVTDWKVGSPIVFQGVWEGVAYQDKGTILKFIPEKKLKYDYWSSFSKMEDVPENYQPISFEISSGDEKSILTLTQDNIPNETALEHSKANWEMVLDQMKKIVETK